MNLANRTLRGDLSLCDFSRAASLKGCVLDGADLKNASFAGQHLAGLSISGADCTGTDFTRCDFSSFVPGTPPPLLAARSSPGPSCLRGIRGRARRCRARCWPGPT